MSDINRDIHELFADYAGALRDGCLPSFLKSLMRKETGQIMASPEFWDAAEVVHALNGVAFADKAKTSNVSLFIERVDAEIASRMRRSEAPHRAKHSAKGRFIKESELK